MSAVTWQHNARAGEMVFMGISEETPGIRVWSEAEPGPEPETLTEAIRQKAWGMLGLRQTIPRNEGAAFLKYARQRGLGAALTRETGADDVVFQDGRYRVQGFALSILFAAVGLDGEWTSGPVREMFW